MKLFEYQAKDIFNQYGIPTPKRVLAEIPEELEAVAQSVGLPCVVKAQVLHGGRGKANLVKVVDTLEALLQEGKRIYEATGQALLVEEKIDIAKELYGSLAMDPVSGNHLFMLCSEGGVDIEELAKTAPDKIIKWKINPFLGMMPFEANELAYRLGVTEKASAKQLAAVLLKMYRIFADEEAALVEINPLVLTGSGEVVALDAKLDIDDSAMFRHTVYPKTRAYYDQDIEFAAAEEGIPYLQFDGDIGMMVAGAGLANVVFDLIHYHGGSVANYLEFGGPNYRKGKKCLEMMLSTNPKCVLIVTFGTIARADVMAEGIVEAVKALKPTIPIICSVKGTGEEEAEALLRSVGLESIKDTEKAVAKAVEWVKGASS